MNKFLSCDWGSSAFRLRLVDSKNLLVLSEVKTGHGITSMFESWTQEGEPKQPRRKFYESYLMERIREIASSCDRPIEQIPIIISGMASSSIGLAELPYKDLPFDCEGTGLITQSLTIGTDPVYRVTIISGASAKEDAIRGEETMLVGCDLVMNKGDTTLIFPGTHSKHLSVENGLVTGIRTYMTGELFDLLSNKSILATSVRRNELDENHDRVFKDAVRKGIEGNLLNNIFQVRINDLFKRIGAEGNYHYLSGLLIGHEVANLLKIKPRAITLVSNQTLGSSYAKAFEVAGLDKIVEYKDADTALINGHRKLLLRLMD